MNGVETLRAVTRRSTFVVFLAAMAILGFVYRSRVLLALFEAGTAYLILSYLYVLLAARRVGVTRELNPRAYEEDSVSIALILRNSGLFPLYRVEVRDWCPTEAVPGKTLVVPEVPGRGRSVRIRYESKCERGRGRFTIGPIQATVTDPLGLFQRNRIVAEFSELIVYPRPFAIHDLGIRGLQTMSLATAAHPQSVGQTPMFYGTREYQPGDNPRWIHWRSSARWGRLVLKEFETPANVALTCFLNLDRSTLCGLGRGSNVELGIRIAASAAQFAESQGHPFQLIADGEEPMVLPPRLGRPGLVAALDALAHARPGRTPYGELLRRGSRFVGEGSAALLFLNRLDFDRDALTEVLAEWLRKRVRGIAVLMDDQTFVPLEEIRGPRDPGRLAAACDFFRALGLQVFTVRATDDLEQVFAEGAA